VSSHFVDQDQEYTLEVNEQFHVPVGLHYTDGVWGWVSLKGPVGIQPLMLKLSIHSNSFTNTVVKIITVNCMPMRTK